MHPFIRQNPRSKLGVVYPSLWNNRALFGPPASFLSSSSRHVCYLPEKAVDLISHQT